MGKNVRSGGENAQTLRRTQKREYLTYFHIAMGETNCLKIVRRVEDELVKHPDFPLPGIFKSC